MIAEHAMIDLNSDKVSDGLRAGDVGAVVHIYVDGSSYEVEFVDGNGSTIALLTLTVAEVRPSTRANYYILVDSTRGRTQCWTETAVRTVPDCNFSGRPSMVRQSHSSIRG